MYMNADPRGEGTALRITGCWQGSQSQSRSCSPVAAVHSFAGGSAPGIAMPASGSSEARQQEAKRVSARLPGLRFHMLDEVEFPIIVDGDDEQLTHHDVNMRSRLMGN